MQKLDQQEEVDLAEALRLSQMIAPTTDQKNVVEQEFKTDEKINQMLSCLWCWIHQTVWWRWTFFYPHQECWVWSSDHDTFSLYC